MQIGDRVKDKGTGFIGTIVQLDPATGTPVRARFMEDDLKEGKPNKDRKVGDEPPESMWQRLEELELVTATGETIAGKRAASLDTAGAKVGADAGNGKKAERASARA